MSEHDLVVATVADRPDLLEPAWERTQGALPEYNGHGDVLNKYWPRLAEEHPEYQFHLLGGGEEILALARSIPVRWDGNVADLPEGVDGAIERGFEEGDANALCALFIAVPPVVQRRGVSAAAVVAMADLARRHGFVSLIAPVRPSAKERYPLAAIERYATWRRPDGSLFDPWMRVHERAGASFLKAEARGLRIAASISDWERWTGLTFPQTGEYWFPGGLATLTVDRSADRGLYFEPNVWMHHRL